MVQRINTALRVGAEERAKLDSAVTARGRGNIWVRIEFAVYSKPNRGGKLLSRGYKEADITVFQLSQFMQASWLAVFAASITATDGSSQAINSAITANTPKIEFGTGSGSAAYTDTAIFTAAGGTNPVTASSTAASSGANTWTVTATWNNTTGSSVTITELALYVTSTAGVTTNKTYCLTHDTFTGQVVSNGGSAAATLTFTMS